MTDETKNRRRRFLPGFDGSLYFAVFNSSEYDRRKARARIIKEFGQEVWKKEVLAKMRTGIMAIFKHKPTRPLRRFAWYVALSADQRHSRRKAVSP